MEGSNQSHNIELTNKMKEEPTSNNSSLSSPDEPVKVETAPSILNLLSNSAATESHDQVDLPPAKVENPDMKEEHEDEEEEEEDPYEAVVYETESGIDKSESEAVTDVNGERPRLAPRKRSSSNPSVGSFTIQCASCFKWRIVPTKEKYEELREKILEEPFFCEDGREWNSELSCDNPPDITQEGTRVWAIDRPNIPRPPHGWERILRFRAKGSSKFADVYYVAPSGRRFRSMVQLQRYLDENPHYMEDGISTAKFSFETPRPLQEDYVRKRSTAASDNGNTASAEAIDILPISWVGPDEEDIQPQMNGFGSSNNSTESSPEISVNPRAKKRKVSLAKPDDDEDVLT